jgi:putative transposase
MNRAASGEDWLADPAVAGILEEQVGRLSSAFSVDLHAYCILPRHYHLLVRAEPPSLLAALARLEADCGLRGVSPRAVPVAFGRHLMSVSRYIHLNPVDAGLVWRPEHWPYSSFRAYLGDVAAPGWIRTEAVLGRFGTIGARHRHRAYVYAGLDPNTRDRDGRPRWSALFGRGTPAEEFAWRIEPGLRPGAQVSPREIPGGPECSLHDLARSVAAVFDVQAKLLRSAGIGGRQAALARGAFIHAARASGRHRLRDVAAFMGYASPAAAAATAERFDRAQRADSALAQRVRDIRRSLDV